MHTNAANNANFFVSHFGTSHVHTFIFMLLFFINVVGKALLVRCPGFLEVVFSFLEVQTGGLVAFLLVNLYCLVV
jgi:hypothetical protein